MCEEKILRICHLSVLRGFSGLRQQLKFEQSAAQHLGSVQWTVKAFFHESDELSAIEQLPKGFRFLFARNLYGWFWLMRYARDYDFVLVRHMPFDPFSLVFAPFIRNRVTVHHSKEMEELPVVRPGWRGKWAAWLERICGNVAIRTAQGLLGVTEEIRAYELCARSLPLGFRSGVYPNGIVVDQIQVADDRRPKEIVVLGFMAGEFQDWHGLDLLLDLITESARTDRYQRRIQLHLIGDILPAQNRQIDSLKMLGGGHEVKVHGHLDEDEYRDVFSRCHVGIGSLALERKGMRQAATLKVREMLALGIPVLSGHEDAAFPEDFMFYRKGAACLENIFSYAEEMAIYSRQEVREAATPYIEKQKCLERVVEFLRTIES